VAHPSVQLAHQNRTAGGGATCIRKAGNDWNEELDELMCPYARRLPVLLDGGEVERGSDDDPLVTGLVP
jgi:hypothetical protein